MERYFQEALKEAKKAYKKNEVPVGAVIVKNDKIIARAYNNRQNTHNVLGHAEINCILRASKKLKDWRLDGCTMYVTLEPCSMCNIIINESRIDTVYFLQSQEKSKKIDTNFTQTNDCEVIKGECDKLLNSFFEKLRK